jgi:hypothetical protein
MGKWLDKVLHEFAVLALAALFILLAYYTWTLLLPWLGLRAP